MPRPEHENWRPGEVARLLALVETERRYYQELFAALPVPAAVLDGELALVAVNREFRRRFRLEYRELGRLRLPDLLPSAVLDEAASRVLDGSETRAEASVEVGLREPCTYRVALQRTQGWQEGDAAEILLTVEESTPAEARATPDAPAPLTAWILDEQAETFIWVSPECESRLGVPEAGWQSVAAWAESRVYPADRPAYLLFYRKTLPAAGQGSIEYRLFDGGAGVRRVREFVTRGADGRYSGVTLDTTGDERARRRDRERAKRGALERLAGRLAHVSNNLLMIISGYSEELMEGLSDADTRRGDVEEIIRASARLAGLTTQLTGLARPPLAEAESFRWNEWRRRVVAVPDDRESGDWIVEGSPALLAQLVSEVRRAAEAFRPPDASLELSLAETGTPGLAEIRITLPGLTAEAAEVFLEPFSGPREGADPPLGLAALIGPLERAGMEVDLDPEDCVLCLRARARRAETAAGPAAAPPATDPQPPPARRATVLLVEDEDGIRALVEKALTRSGYEVLSAPWAEEALTICQQRAEPVDLLISDIVMPGAGGREVAEQLRARWPGLRVLFISGHHDDALIEEDLLAGHVAGATLLLRKPFTLAELQSSVEVLLGQKRASTAASE